MVDIKKLIIRIYYYIKNFIKNVKIKISKFNILTKYNLIKLQKRNINNQECIFCLDDLNLENINYKCKYCSISFHEKCFKKYLNIKKYSLCIQCNR